MVADGAASDLEQHHRLARTLGRRQRRDKHIGLGDALDIGGNHVDLGVLHVPMDDLADCHIRLVAGGDALRRADAAVARQRDQVGTKGPGLADHTNAPRQGPTAFKRGGEGGIPTQRGIEQPQAVGPQQAHAMLARGPCHLLLQRCTLHAHFGKAGAEHHGRANPARAQGFNGVQYLVRGHGDDGSLRRGGQGVDGRERGQALNLAARGVDRVDGALEAGTLHPGDGPPANAPGVGRGADHGHAVRRHQAAQAVHAGDPGVHIGSQRNTSLERSTPTKLARSAGMACSATVCGVQPSPRCTERNGRG